MNPLGLFVSLRSQSVRGARKFDQRTGLNGLERATGANHCERAEKVGERGADRVGAHAQGLDAVLAQLEVWGLLRGRAV